MTESSSQLWSWLFDAEFFGEHKPSRIIVPVSKLHFGCLVEIEAIAEVDKK